MAKNKMTKIMAFLALFWITIWIVWTGILILFSGNNTNNEQDITPEQYLELQDLIKNNSWENIDTKTLTWEIN